MVLPILSQSKAKAGLPATSVLSRNLTSAPAQQQQGEKRLYKYQDTLPRLPVPALEETLPKFLETCRPLLSKEEFARTEQLVREFPDKGSGKKLQELLLNKAQTTKFAHWLEEWWDNLAYLEYRDPICIWVNYGFTLKDEKYDYAGANPQTNRAARMVYAALKFKHLVDTEQLEPDMVKTTAFCAYQYQFLFNACRQPKEVRDKMVQHPGSRHIVVSRSNRFYYFNVLDEKGVPYSPADIEAQLERVIAIDNAKKEVTHPIGLFTAEQRDEWAKIYKVLEADPVNRATLDKIESSIMNVCLDDLAPEKLHDIAYHLLNSDAKNRWFDKQIQLIIFKNGKGGYNYEHARIDGLTTIRLTNYTFEESQKLAMGQRSQNLPAPVKLDWRVNQQVESFLASSEKNVKALIDNNEIDGLEFTAFGGSRLKALKQSPDSFVQLAFQLSFYRMNGHLCGTYESASTKEFLHGRTEVVRSATSAALDFCKAMERNSNKGLKERQDLMQKALAAHNSYMKFAKAAKGVDRHLMGLRLIAAENGIPKPELFNDVGHIRSSHWNLSTSNCGSPNLRLFSFGPVVEDGYGLGYMIQDDSINVGITAKNSCNKTSAKLLGNHIELSFHEMHNLAAGVQSKL